MKLFVLVAMLVAITGVAVADTVAEKQARLEKLKAEVATLEKELATQPAATQNAATRPANPIEAVIHALPANLKYDPKETEAHRDARNKYWGRKVEELISKPIEIKGTLEDVNTGQKIGVWEGHYLDAKCTSIQLKSTIAVFGKAVPLRVTYYLLDKDKKILKQNAEDLKVGDELVLKGYFRPQSRDSYLANAFGLYSSAGDLSSSERIDITLTSSDTKMPKTP